MIPQFLTSLVCFVVVLLVLQGVGGQRGDGGAEERSGHQRDPSLRGSVPQHQAREHPGRRSRQVSSHGWCFSLLFNFLGFCCFPFFSWMRLKLGGGIFGKKVFNF